MKVITSGLGLSMGIAPSSGENSKALKGRPASVDPMQFELPTSIEVEKQLAKKAAGLKNKNIPLVADQIFNRDKIN